MATTSIDTHEVLTSGRRSDELQRKAHRRITAKWPEGQQSFSNPVMVSITTLPGVAKQRLAPVDVVLVLHVHIRLLVPANWHDLLIEAIDLVIGKLGVNDRLAIVPASLTEPKAKKTEQDTINITLPMKPKLFKMTNENKKMASHAVRSSEAIMRRNAPLIKDLESAELALYDSKYDESESDEKVDRASYIIVISNSNNENLSSLITWRFRSVHAFGFQDARNVRTLCTIASNSESTYAIFDDGGRISEAFAASIDRITSAMEPLEVKLKCEQDVLLSAISAPRMSYFITYDKKVGVIWANAHLTLGAETNFIVYLEVPKLRWRNPESGSLLNVEVKYGHHPNSNNLISVKPLVFSCKCKGLDESMEVQAEKVRMETVKIVAEITAEDKSDSQKLHDAADWLRRRWNDIEKESREAADAGLLFRLAAEIQEMETRLCNNHLWLEYMLSWRTHQWWPLAPHITGKHKATTTNPLLQVTIFAKVDGIPEPIPTNQQGLPVLVHVMVPVEGLAKVKRPPVDLVVVLGISRGTREMKKKRLQLLNKAMEFIIAKLSCKDRLAIIPVKSTVTGPGTGLFQGKKKRRSELVKLLHVVTPSTNPSTKAISQQLKMRKVGRTYLPISTFNTSGIVISGGTTELLSMSLVDAVELLDNRGEDEKERMGLIVLISDMDGTSILKKTPSTNYTVHAFSFHDAENAKTMYDIARIYSGIYAIIADQQDRITEAFMECIKNITSTIAVNTNVNIVCSRSSDVKLSAIESGHFTCNIMDNGKEGSIFAGALYAGAVRRFIAYLENVREENYEDLSNLLTVDVTWQTVSNSMRSTTQGHVEVVRNQNDASTEVVEEIVRLKEVEIVRGIIDSDTNGADVLTKMQGLRNMAMEARIKMRHQVDMRVRRPKSNSSAFAIDQESLANYLKNKKDGLWFSYILSWLSFQGICEKPPSAPSKTS